MPEQLKFPFIDSLPAHHIGRRGNVFIATFEEVLGIIMTSVLDEFLTITLPEYLT
jgi:hypothetical protein